MAARAFAASLLNSAEVMVSTDISSVIMKSNGISIMQVCVAESSSVFAWEKSCRDDFLSLFSEKGGQITHKNNYNCGNTVP